MRQGARDVRGCGGRANREKAGAGGAACGWVADASAHGTGKGAIHLRSARCVGGAERAAGCNAAGCGQRAAACLLPSVDTNSSPTATMRSWLALSQPPLEAGSAGLVSRRRGASLEE